MGRQGVGACRGRLVGGHQERSNVEGIKVSPSVVSMSHSVEVCSQLVSASGSVPIPKRRSASAYEPTFCETQGRQALRAPTSLESQWHILFRSIAPSVSTFVCGAIGRFALHLRVVYTTRKRGFTVATARRGICRVERGPVASKRLAGSLI